MKMTDQQKDWTQKPEELYGIWNKRQTCQTHSTQTENTESRHNQLSRRTAALLYRLPADRLQPAEGEHHRWTQQLLVTRDLDLENALFTSGPWRIQNTSPRKDNESNRSVEKAPKTKNSHFNLNSEGKCCLQNPNGSRCLNRPENHIMSRTSSGQQHPAPGLSPTQTQSRLSHSHDAQTELLFTNKTTTCLISDHTEQTIRD